MLADALRMFFYLFLALVAVMASIYAWAAPAGHFQCGPRAGMLAALAAQHGELRTARGTMPNGLLLEVLAGPAGNWTVILAQPDGSVCIGAFGDAWTEERCGRPA